MSSPTPVESLQLLKGPIVLLFTGGLDSTIGRHYLEYYKLDHHLVYFYTGASRYTDKEVQYLHDNKFPVEIDGTLQWLGQYEQPASAFVPYRNLFFAMVAAIKYAPNVMICGVEDDDVPDKNEHSFDLWSRHLSYIGKDPVRVFSPFWHTHKHEAVAWYLETGGTKSGLLNTISCYSDTRSTYCGSCRACFRKWAALKVNGMDIGFQNDNIKEYYRTRALNGVYTSKRNELILTALR